MVVEKIIHQTWKNKVLAPKNQSCVNTVKSKFDDYEYKFWTDEDNEKLIRDHFPEFYESYLKLVPIEKSDFSRYLYIYTHGGVYMDVDIVVFKRFDDILIGDYDAFLCNYYKENKTIGGGSRTILDPFFLAGKKGTRFFYSICEAICRGNVFRLLAEIPEDLPYTLYSTGPLMLTKFYMMEGGKYKIKLLDGVFANAYTYAESENKDQFHAVHLQYSTWSTQSRPIPSTQLKEIGGIPL